MNKRFDELYEHLLNEMVYSVDDNKNRDVLYTAPDSKGSMDIMNIIQAIENNDHYVMELNSICQDETNTSQFRQKLSAFFEKMKSEDKSGKLAEIPQPVWDSLVNYAFSRISGDSLQDATLPAWKGAPAGMRMVDAFDQMMIRRINSPEENKQIIPFTAYVKNYTKTAGGGGLDNLFGPDKE